MRILLFYSYEFVAGVISTFLDFVFEENLPSILYLNYCDYFTKEGASGAEKRRKYLGQLQGTSSLTLFLVLRSWRRNYVKFTRGKSDRRW